MGEARRAREGQRGRERWGFRRQVPGQPRRAASSECGQARLQGVTAWGARAWRQSGPDFSLRMGNGRNTEKGQ